MKTRTRGLGVVAVSLLAVLGLMGLAAGRAQATWLINGTSFHGTESVAVEDHLDAVSLIPAKNLEIQCHVTVGSDVLITESTLITGTLVLSQCLTFRLSPLARFANCDYINQPINWGFKGHLFLHGGKNYLLLEPPKAGGAFTVVEFSEICALVETSELTGSVVFECGHLSEGAFVGLDCGTQQVKQLLKEAPNQTLFDEVITLGDGKKHLINVHGIRFGENVSTRHGILSMALSGSNASKTWGGHV